MILVPEHETELQGKTGFEVGARGICDLQAANMIPFVRELVDGLLSSLLVIPGNFLMF
jgi:hypothetical protein